MIDPRQRLEPIPGLEGAHEGGGEDPLVVRMDQSPPTVGQMRVRLDAEEGAITPVGEHHLRGVVAHPDQGGRAVGDRAEAVLGFF